MNKLHAIWQIIIMLAAVGVTAFGVFKWMDAREDAESDITEWMEKQETVQEADETFKLMMTNGINMLVVKIDSSLEIGRENQRAIYANRRVIVKQIQEDTSLSGNEVFELLQPLMEGVEDLKKNNGRTPYAIE